MWTLQRLWGEARTTQVMIRRHYRGGRNFGCVVGVDLMTSEGEQDLYDYLDKARPFVCVMAPQCTGLAGWANYNQKMALEAHRRSAAVSLHLGRVCGNCALMQLERKLHFFTEQPADSDLYQTR